MTKYFGYGAVLQVTTTTGDAALAQVVSISGPGVDFPEVDTTTMDSSSNYRTSVPGLGNPGDVTIALMYDPTATTPRTIPARSILFLMPLFLPLGQQFDGSRVARLGIGILISGHRR